MSQIGSAPDPADADPGERGARRGLGTAPRDRRRRDTRQARPAARRRERSAAAEAGGGVGKRRPVKPGDARRARGAVDAMPPIDQLQGRPIGRVLTKMSKVTREQIVEALIVPEIQGRWRWAGS